MPRGVFIKTCILLAVTTHAQGQYIDFFNSFLQPFTTTKPRSDVTKRPDTKHRQTNRLKYQDAIFFESNEFLKQRENSRTVDVFNIYSTTTKPRRKSKTTSTGHSYTTNKPKSVNSNKIVNNNINNHAISNNNGDGDVDNRVVNNARRIDNYNNGYDNVYNNYNIYGETTKATNLYGQNNNRQTTERTTNYNNGKTTQKTDYYGQTTKFYGNERTTNRPNSRPIYNRKTTKNPLLNRPGVKPAVVDENRPPITNKPVTVRPGYDRPFETVTYRPPVYTRPPLAPRPPVNTRPPSEPRPPVNTRPQFETARPIATGVVPPASGAGPSNEDADIDIEIGPDEDEMGDAEKRRLYDICEQKCEEYKSISVRKLVALPLGGAGAHRAEVNVSSCTPDNVPLIIGGQLARIETFPHMALLGWKFTQTAGYAWKCGGSLVSERYVLTAGHCTYHDKDYNVMSGPPGAVQLGSAIYNDRTATVVLISAVVRHPKYKLRRSYYDVALLKLAAQVSFSETIRPACLGVPPAVGESVVATGWGKTEYGGDSSIQLRSVSIPVWDMGDCRDIWGTSLKLPNGPMPDNQICAGERKGAKDTCQGDSGGPAQVRDGCAWRVVAVTSVGRSCGAPDTPALYARVPRAFIARQVYTNIKTGRDGNTQYGNQGINGNNNSGNGNNNSGNGNNNWNTGINNGGISSNQNGNRDIATSRPNNSGNGNTNSGNGNNNWTTGNNNGGTSSSQNGNRGIANTRPNNSGNGNTNSGNRNNNWNIGNNNGGTSSNQNGNRGVVNTRPTQNNNQYYADSQGPSTDNRGIVNNNGNNYDLNNKNNNWGVSSENSNRYNQNNGNNRNVYDQTYNNNHGQTTNSYSQNIFGQNNYNSNANNFGQNGYYNEQSQSGRTENPIIRNYGTQSAYNDNGSTDNGYNRNNDNRYSIYQITNRPWYR